MAKLMAMEDRIKLTRKQLGQTVKDYGKYTDGYVIDRVSGYFLDKLARDAVEAKWDFYEMFSGSPAWDDELGCLVINGNRTHEKDYDAIRRLIRDIILPLHGTSKWDCVVDTLGFWTYKNPSEDELEAAINAINKLAPHAYAPGKKPSKVFRALCQELGLVDETAGSQWQKFYAKLADELSAKKIDFKWYVSPNPCHFITMSNPKRDSRGEMMTSCHSFNSTDYEYNSGCTGYARDSVTLIGFTAKDDGKDPESLNNRKTSRQLFMYKPGNGVLLQSRLYSSRSGDSYGGMNGEQPESKVYRELVQKEIADAENAPNLWVTRNYTSNPWDFEVKVGRGFGGYPDWHYRDMNPKLSIRQDCMETKQEFSVGTWGLCADCGTETDYGVFCEDCKCQFSCDECGDSYDDEDDLYTVYRDGNEIQVCAYCRNEYYRWCECCESYHHVDEMTYIDGEDADVCDECRDRYYEYCEDCDEYHHEDCMNTAYDRYGNEVRVCDDCLNDHYTECDECGEYYHNDYMNTAYRDGEEVQVCDDCLDQYEKCEACDDYNYKDDFVNVLDEDGNTVKVCRYCAEDYYMTCAICGDLHRVRDMVGVVCEHCINVETGVNDEQEIA